MRILISGYYGFGNAGDEALLMSLLQALPRTVEPIVLSQTPELTAQTYNVQAYPRMDGLILLKLLQSAQAFIWGGGSLLQDVTSWQSPLYYLSLMALAQRLGLTTIAWAQGIGPLQYGWNRWLTRECLRRCAIVSIRDPQADALLKTWRIPHHIGCDPVWILTPTEALPWQPPEARCVALVLRAHPDLTTQRLRILIQALTDFQRRQQVHLILVPFQLDPHTQVGPDLVIAQAVNEGLPGSSEVVVLQDPRQLRALFQHVEMTIAMRYHGLVMAAAAGCKCFSLSYDPKVMALAKQLDMPVWDLKALPEDPQTMTQAWCNYFEAEHGLGAAGLERWQQSGRIHADLLQQALS